MQNRGSQQYTRTERHRGTQLTRQEPVAKTTILAIALDFRLMATLEAILTRERHHAISR